MGTDRYDDLACFVKVAEVGSIAHAAPALGRSPSQVSRTLTRLEDRLGVRLLHRTTRRLTLTEEGRALFERARTSLAELDEAEAAVGHVQGTPRGRLRVSLPVLFGHRFVAPLAARFAAENPRVTVDLAFDDRKVDLVDEGFDLAVRVGVDDDPTLTARRLGSTQVLTVASPDYLCGTAPIAHPRDLAAHEVLLLSSEVAGASWRFKGPDDEVDVALTPTRFAANSGFALREAALLGLGVARLPDFMVGEDVASGALVRLLTPWERTLTVAAVYPPGRHLAPKVRRFVDFLGDHLQGRLWSA